MHAQAPCNRRGLPIPTSFRMISAKLKPPACTSRRFRMLSLPFMHTSHSAGFVQVRHTSFRQLTSLPLQSLAARSPNPPPVGVHLLLLIGFPFPLPRTSLRLGNVADCLGTNVPSRNRANIGLVASKTSDTL